MLAILPVVPCDGSVPATLLLHTSVCVMPARWLPACLPLVSVAEVTGCSADRARPSEAGIAGPRGRPAGASLVLLLR